MRQPAVPARFAPSPNRNPVRTRFQRDRDRILHSKSFRRLMHKTQVFIAPAGDHYRTRLTHTLEVTQSARTVGRALRLNEDLIEAIASGHDLGIRRSATPESGPWGRSFPASATTSRASGSSTHSSATVAG